MEAFLKAKLGKDVPSLIYFNVWRSNMMQVNAQFKSYVNFDVWSDELVILLHRGKHYNWRDTHTHGTCWCCIGNVYNRLSRPVAKIPENYYDIKELY